MKTNYFDVEKPLTPEEIRYREVLRQVKRQRGFYYHATIYVLVNIFIILSQVIANHESWNNVELYYTAFFWGIGLAAHGLSVFMPNFFLGKEWEERKINELMDKNRNLHS